MRGPSENLQCKNPSFFTKWWDLLDLSKKKILLDLVYMHPGGVRIATDLFLFWKNAIMKHPNVGHSYILSSPTPTSSLEMKLLFWAPCKCHYAAGVFGTINWFTMNLARTVECCRLVWIAFGEKNHHARWVGPSNPTSINSCLTNPYHQISPAPPHDM